MNKAVLNASSLALVLFLGGCDQITARVAQSLHKIERTEAQANSAGPPVNTIEKIPQLQAPSAPAANEQAPSPKMAEADAPHVAAAAKVTRKTPGDIEQVSRLSSPEVPPERREPRALPSHRPRTVTAPPPPLQQSSHDPLSSEPIRKRPDSQIIKQETVTQPTQPRHGATPAPVISSDPMNPKVFIESSGVSIRMDGTHSTVKAGDLTIEER